MNMTKNASSEDDAAACHTNSHTGVGDNASTDAGAHGHKEQVFAVELFHGSLLLPKTSDEVHERPLNNGFM